MSTCKHTHTHTHTHTHHVNLWDAHTVANNWSWVSPWLWDDCSFTHVVDTCSPAPAQVHVIMPWRTHKSSLFMCLKKSISKKTVTILKNPVWLWVLPWEQHMKMKWDAGFKINGHVLLINMVLGIHSDLSPTSNVELPMWLFFFSFLFYYFCFGEMYVMTRSNYSKHLTQEKCMPGPLKKY